MDADEQLVPNAITRWIEKEISDIQLLRQFVAYPRWGLPIAEDAMREAMATNAMPNLQFHEDEAGVKRLFIFSSREAWERFPNRGEPGKQAFISLNGESVFLLPIHEFGELIIDPGSPYTIAYKPEHFPMLQSTAFASSVERALFDVRTKTPSPPDAVAFVSEYQGYLVVLKQIHDGWTLLTAPDPKGRTLGAIFTHDDTVQAFIEDTEPDEGYQVMNLPPEELWEQLAKMQWDGLVFNCSGPVKPVAFAPQFATVMLNSVKSRPRPPAEA